MGFRPRHTLAPLGDTRRVVADGRDAVGLAPLDLEPASLDSVGFVPSGLLRFVFVAGEVVVGVVFDWEFFFLLISRRLHGQTDYNAIFTVTAAEYRW